MPITTICILLTVLYPYLILERLAKVNRAQSLFLKTALSPPEAKKKKKSKNKFVKNN